MAADIRLNTSVVFSLLSRPVRILVGALSTKCITDEQRFMVRLSWSGGVSLNETYEGMTVPYTNKCMSRNKLY